MSYFNNETASKNISEGRWSGFVSKQWNIGNNPNGGYLVCIALGAITKLSTKHLDPLTVTAHFLRPGIPNAPCEILTENIRSGRTISTIRASLIQEDKPRVEILAGFGDLSSNNFESSSIKIPAPMIPSPKDCPQRSASEQGIILPLLKRLDVRISPREERKTDNQAQVSGWIRLLDGQNPSPLNTVLFADAFPPSIFGLLGNIGWVPTIELTVHIRRKPSPGWVLGQFNTFDLNNGRIIEDGLLWDSNGDLIAQSRQISLLLNP
ncbi:MAG: thioesterase family protein [Candidatus Azotimanducaceae bacterium]